MSNSVIPTNSVARGQAVGMNATALNSGGLHLTRRKAPHCKAVAAFCAVFSSLLDFSDGSNMNHLTIILAALLLFMAMSFQNESCSGKQQTVNTKSQSVNIKKVAVQTEARMTKGTWGGNHISMEVTEEGAQIEYDCAHGTISEPVKIDSHGKFSAKGTHVRERGGPIRVGSEEKGEPVIYSGTTDGKTATLTVTNSATDEVIGTFTLTLGKGSRITKCL
ncbi:MAG: hypothetical protein H0U18_08180 [Pyrinomonadaceae bacterium]|nr:hypothetical protein [Pyrinomonadaceae bacterium]